MIWRFVPLVGLLLFYGLGFGWRTWLHARRYGASGIALFRSDRPLQHVRELLFVVLALALFAQAIAVVLRPAVPVVAMPPALEALARAAGVACDTDFAMDNRPYHAIIDAAKRHGCDAIFMSTHGREGLAKLWYGSATAEVLAHSDIPTLVYR